MGRFFIPTTPNGPCFASSFPPILHRQEDRKSTRLNSSHTVISYAVFCLKKKKNPPSAVNPPPACRFNTRCWKPQEICRTVTPTLQTHNPGNVTACTFTVPRE